MLIITSFRRYPSDIRVQNQKTDGKYNALVAALSNLIPIPQDIHQEQPPPTVFVQLRANKRHVRTV